MAKKKKRKAAKRGGQIPLGILEKRLKKLGGIVEKRGSDLYVTKD